MVASTITGKLWGRSRERNDGQSPWEIEAQKSRGFWWWTAWRPWPGDPQQGYRPATSSMPPARVDDRGDVDRYRLLDNSGLWTDSIADINNACLVPTHV